MRGFAALVVVVVARSAVPAAAQPAPSASPASDLHDTARAADEAGRGHYQAHDYAAAIADYRRAYEALPEPAFLFDIAQAYRQLRDCDNASAFYRRYLQEQPAAENRDKVERFIADMDACAKEQQDARAAAAPIAHATPIAAQPSAATAATAATAEDGRATLRLAGIATGAAGVALLGSAVYFSFDASRQAHNLEAACANGCLGSAVASIDHAGKNAERAEIALYVVGGAAVAAGATLYLWTMLHVPGEPPIVTPTAGGATVAMSVRF